MNPILESKFTNTYANIRAIEFLMKNVCQNGKKCAIIAEILIFLPI